MSKKIRQKTLNVIMMMSYYRFSPPQFCVRHLVSHRQLIIYIISISFGDSSTAFSGFSVAAA